jgi:hypothetical protein
MQSDLASQVSGRYTVYRLDPYSKQAYIVAERLSLRDPLIRNLRQIGKRE